MREERRRARRQRVEYLAHRNVRWRRADRCDRIQSPRRIGLRFPGSEPAKTYKVIGRIGHDVGAKLIGTAAQPMQKD